jgi:chromosome segregation ATPase
MSNTLPIVIAASVFAGGAGAIATTVLTAPSKPAANDASVQTPNDEVLAAIDALREDTRALVDRVEALEIGAELAPVGGGPTRVASSITMSDVEELLDARLGGDGEDVELAAVTPEVLKTVEAAIELREERQRQEREQRRIEQEQQRMEDRLADLQTKLGLDQNQVNQMRTIFQDEAQRRDEMRDTMRELRDSGTMDRDQVRQLWTDARDATNQAIQGVLSPAQYEQYQEENSNNRWGGGMGRDRGAQGGGRRGR